jgi:hypothetical protein
MLSGHFTESFHAFFEERNHIQRLHARERKTGKGDKIIQQMMHGPHRPQHPGGNPFIVGVTSQLPLENGGIQLKAAQRVLQLLAHGLGHLLHGGKTLAPVEMHLHQGRKGHILQGEKKTGHMQEWALQIIAADEHAALFRTLDRCRQLAEQTPPGKT